MQMPSRPSFVPIYRPFCSVACFSMPSLTCGGQTPRLPWSWFQSLGKKGWTGCAATPVASENDWQPLTEGMTLAGCPSPCRELTAHSSFCKNEFQRVSSQVHFACGDFDFSDLTEDWRRIRRRSAGFARFLHPGRFYRGVPTNDAQKTKSRPPPFYTSTLTLPRLGLPLSLSAVVPR